MSNVWPGGCRVSNFLSKFRHTAKITHTSNAQVEGVASVTHKSNAEDEGPQHIYTQYDGLGRSAGGVVSAVVPLAVLS